MPITYNYDAEAGILRADVAGVVDVPQIYRYLEDVLSDGLIDHNFIEVVNFTDTENLIVSFADLTAIRGVWERYLEKGCAATILLAPSDLMYGLCRVIQYAVGADEFEWGSPFEIVRTPAAADALIQRLRIRKISS